MYIPIKRILSETLPWLLARNRFQQADKVVKRAAKWNGVEVPKIWKDLLKENSSVRI